MKPLNIVLLVLDTLRADRLSCYGYPIETSPNLDKFASEATRFTHAYATAQWTIPSHASMFTGLYPSQHTLLQVDSILPATLPTLAERLKQAGYFTAGFSNNVFVGVMDNGLERGFNSFVNYAGGQYRETNQSGTTGFKRLLNKLLTSFKTAAAQSALVRRIASSPLMSPLIKKKFWQNKYAKGDTVQSLADASHMLIERPGISPDQPLFVFINLMGTHRPYNCPDWAVERFVPQSSSQNISAFVKDLNSYLRGLPNILTDELPPERKAALGGMYNAEVAAQDAQLGLFLDQLRDAGVLDDTLFMIVGDHGEHLGEKQLFGHSFGVHEELLHVPLLIRDPLGDFPHGTTQNGLVSIRRLFHTALTVAGIATREEEALTLAQPSETDFIEDIVFAEAWPESVKLRHLRRNHLQLHGYDQAHFAIYNNDYKLTATKKNSLALYAIYDDPTERINLQTSHQYKKNKLYEKLKNFMQETTFIAPEMKLEIDDPILVERFRDLGYLE